MPVSRPVTTGPQDEPMPTDPNPPATWAWLADCIVHRAIPSGTPERKVRFDGRPVKAKRETPRRPVMLATDSEPEGHSLKCYQCTNITHSCADKEVTCPESSSCFSSTMVTENGNSTIKMKIKGCISNLICINGHTDFNSANVSYSCCSTDLCNAKDAPDPSSSTAHDVPNGKKCYQCYGPSCSDIVDCKGSEDHCIIYKGTYSGLSFNVKGCASKATCDSLTSIPYGQGVSCCTGNLCNGAQSVAQSFLFLCCSLLSFILLH